MWRFLIWAPLAGDAYAGEFPPNIPGAFTLLWKCLGKGWKTSTHDILRFGAF